MPGVEDLAPLFPALEFLGMIGRGGMGAVYQARQKSLERMVAVKILLPGEMENPEFGERFLREAQALARLSHPNIVALYDFGRTVRGHWYFIMEYVDGSDLARLMREEKLTPAAALELIPWICDALACAHEAGFIHRDIKPANILVHLDLCDPIHERKEHDISVIKRATLDALRGGTPKGTPVILVWDRTIIDYRFLQKVKDQGGLYFITRPKSNSNLTRVGFQDITPTPVNQGVTSDELVAPGGTGRIIRRITWIDPDSGEAWQYLTNEMKLSPGFIVFLYRQRWNLEKVYDQFKNKLNEKKSWASNVTAKAAQAVFLCLLDNLMVLFEAALAETGITNQAEEKRREKVLTERTQRVGKTDRNMPFIIAGFQRLTQRTVKFIRWLRSFFWQNRPLDELRLILKKRYAAL